MTDQDIWNLSIAVASVGGACVALLVQMLIRWRKRAQVRKARAIAKQHPNRSIDLHTAIPISSLSLPPSHNEAWYDVARGMMARNMSESRRLQHTHQRQQEVLQDISMWESLEPVRAEPAAEEPPAEEPPEEEPPAEVHVPMCPPPSVWERLLDDDDA